ncbi:telomere repeats-binding bouquet formation protein 2 [Notolabrus celidotus]|uniref:telomere repeats-binding bouquet formation protein 2 n=1 Tax=Notolabrus celidotus TaxID=1203425 RepID=UPI0014902796|nr:telomere repeats-binding bouquet formation protein 2 [Notolabrus celidotus]
MFGNKSAWFSSSVPQTRQNMWIVEGGTITCWRKADYLFSEDASCPDTLRIFESKDYLWNKVVVFHSRFLSVCEERQSVKSVCIGHYVLPPASVQDEVREVVGRLIWESEDELSVVQVSPKSCSCQIDDSSSTDSSESEAPPCGHYLDSDKLTGYISMDNLKRYSGDLADYHPGCFRCSNCEAHYCLQQT